MDTSPLNINIDLSTVVTTVPLIADGTSARVRLKNITQGDREGVTIVKWEFTLAEPAATMDGGTVKPGFPLFVNFATDQEWLLVKMSRFIDALLGTGDSKNTRNRPPRPNLNAQSAEAMIGKEAFAKVIVTRSKKSDYVGNDIQSLTAIEDTEAAQPNHNGEQVKLLPQPF